DVSTPATWISLTVILVRDFSGPLVLSACWTSGSSCSVAHESPTPTGSSGGGTAMDFMLLPNCSVTGDAAPASPVKAALNTCMRSSYTTSLLIPRIRSSAGRMAPGPMPGASSDVESNVTVTATPP